MQLSLQRDGEVPLYRQIVQQVGDQIRSGALPAGYRLPPVRQVASDNGLTRLTVHSAYAELQAQGLVEAHVGRGTFVSAVPVPPPDWSPSPSAPWTGRAVLADLVGLAGRPGLISFAQAFPDPATYPHRELSRSFQRALEGPGGLGYGTIQGDAELREQIGVLLRERGVAAPPEQMLITAGAQQAIDVVLRALCGPDDVLLVEEPVYPGVLERAALHGQRVIGVARDPGGVRLDALDAACAAYRPRMLYLVPTFHNPTGRTLAPERRGPVLELAHRYHFLVVEDDVYGLLPFDGPAAPALKADDRQDQVVYLTSFSKMLAPALRIGALIAPSSLLSSLLAAKQSTDLVCSSLLQQALAGYLRHGHLAAHLSRTRDLYRQRRDAMLDALQRSLPDCRWSSPAGGLSLWVQLPEGVGERDVVTDALERGVGVVPGRAFFARPSMEAGMRLSFGLHDPETIERGVALLGDVVRRQVRLRSRLVSLSPAAGPLV